MAEVRPRGTVKKTIFWRRTIRTLFALAACAVLHGGATAAPVQPPADARPLTAADRRYLRALTPELYRFDVAIRPPVTMAQAVLTPAGHPMRPAPTARPQARFAAALAAARNALRRTRALHPTPRFVAAHAALLDGETLAVRGAGELFRGAVERKSAEQTLGAADFQAGVTAEEKSGRAMGRAGMAKYDLAQDVRGATRRRR